MVACGEPFYFAIMNNDKPFQPAEFCLRRTLADIKAFAQREPGQAVAAALGVGLLINLLPPRLLVGAATVVGVTLVRPVLLTLGLTKVMELCCQNTSTQLPS